MNADIATTLAEAIAWCSLHARAADAGISTRSPLLRPPVMALPREHRLRWLLDLPGEAAAVVRAVCVARRRAITQLRIPVAPVDAIPVAPVDAHLAGGRVLLTTIDTDSCEAATDPPNGYYDLDDLPGWDTWFWHQPTEQRGGRFTAGCPGRWWGWRTRGWT